MVQYRVVVEVPGAEKPLQTFCVSETSAFKLLDVLIKNQPKGTKFKVYRAMEQLLSSGEVE